MTILPYLLRGDEAKKRFLKKYKNSLHCVWHSVLGKGQKNKKCCCGREIEGEYFEFAYGDEQNADKKFYGGPECARKLAELADIRLPVIFDPFVHEAGGGAVHTHAAKSGESDSSEIPLENKELITATNLLLYLRRLYWPGRKNTYFHDIKTEFENNPQKRITDRILEVLNNAAKETSNDKGVDTLRELLSQHTASCKKTAKRYSFPNLEKRLKASGKGCSL